MAGHVVAVTEGLSTKMAKKYVPRARLQVFGASDNPLEGVCSGAVFAAMVADSAVHDSVFRMPENCELRLVPIPGATLWSGVASSGKHPDAARVPDLLREEIGAMVRDGTFSTISLKWFGYPTKIEAGKVAMELSPFDLRLVIEEVDEMLAPKAAEHKLDLVLEYPSAVPRHFIGDAGRIRQVVTNLVGNAVKFSSNGCVLITVDCPDGSGPQCPICISVRDNGPGIPQEKIDLLFRKFSQVDASRTRKYGGTGLGLAISRQLVQLMGGSIVAESRVGEGSTFWFTLLLSQDAQPHAAPVPAADLRDLRVLIVDDNEVNRRVLHEQIASWGMRNGSFSSGEQALEGLRAARQSGDPYHFAILDYQMPGMNGDTLARAIKSDPTIRSTVLVMLTSMGHWGAVRDTESASIDACLSKPVRHSQLLNTLATAWSKKQHVALADPAKPASRIAEMKSALAQRSARWAIRVLVAEDNVVNQKVAVRMLEGLGLRADVAANGRETVRIFELLPYDLVLMDCQMPEMDGYEATREIRRREGPGRHVAIIAMTADAMAGCREQCLEAGMDDFVAKPVALEALFEILQRWAPVKEPEPARPEHQGTPAEAPASGKKSRTGAGWRCDGRTRCGRHGGTCHEDGKEVRAAGKIAGFWGKRQSAGGSLQRGCVCRNGRR